jgi:hypothetical protein
VLPLRGADLGPRLWAEPLAATSVADLLLCGLGVLPTFCHDSNPPLQIKINLSLTIPSRPASALYLRVDIEVKTAAKNQRNDDAAVIRILFRPAG